MAAKYDDETLPANINMDGITEEYTPAQIAFVGYFIAQDFKRPDEAYKKAYPNCTTQGSADACASRMLKNAKIRLLIEKQINDVLGARKAILKREIFDYWYKRMTYDPTDIIGLDGHIMLTKEQLKETGLYVCVDGIREKLNAQGDSVIEIDLANKDKAADRLADYIHMITPSPTVNVNLNKDTTNMTPEEEAAYREQLKACFPDLGVFAAKGKENTQDTGKD